VHPYPGRKLCFAVVDRLSRRYPGIEFHLATAYLEPLRRQLSERNLDFLIVRRFRPTVDEQMDFEFLFDDSYVVAVGAQNPWARRRRIELAELASEPWTLPPSDSVIGAIARESFHAAGLDYPRTSVVVDSPEVRISLLATGRFVTIFPASVLKFPTMRSEIKVLPLKLPMAHVQNVIVTLKNRALSPVAQLFVDCAREDAKKVAKKR
jgi:DNA-binding transcriptional LysR family regulator